MIPGEVPIGSSLLFVVIPVVIWLCHGVAPGYRPAGDQRPKQHLQHKMWITKNLDDANMHLYY